MADEIKMDKKVFEALASETRIDILKKLDKRQMTISELSRDLEMAKSSIHEHLAKMAESGLVEKFDNGHKWTYYYLTRKGRNILRPHETAKILLLLGVSLLAIASGALNVFNMVLGGPAVQLSGAEKMAVPEAAEQMLRAPAEAEMAALGEPMKAVEPAACTAEPSLIFGALLIAGGIILGYLAYDMWSRTKPKRFKQNPE